MIHGDASSKNTEEINRSEQNVSLCVQVSSFRVGSDIAISFEFRTSKTSGVLLAVSNQASDGLGIEIVQGKVATGGHSSLTLVNEKKLIDIGPRVQKGNFSVLSFSPHSSSSTWTTGPAGSQHSTNPRVTASATVAGTQSPPANCATGWSWWWTANRAKRRVPTHARPPATPATRFTWEGILVGLHVFHCKTHRDTYSFCRSSSTFSLSHSAYWPQDSTKKSIEITDNMTRRDAGSSSRQRANHSAFFPNKAASDAVTEFSQ